MDVSVFSNEETTYFNYNKRLYETDMAVAFQIRGQTKWIPKSAITAEDKNAKIVCVKTWFAKKT